MATSRLLLSTDLSADAPVIVAGTVVPGEYERLRDALDSRSPGLSALFAEPVFGSKTPTGYRNASWYAGVEGEPVALTALPEAVRPAVGEGLAARLAELRPLLEDPSLGPLLRHALLVPSLDAVQVVGNHIVLVKWGFVPSSLPQSQDALERHFKATLGALTGQPWLSGPAAPEAPQAQALPPHAGPVPAAPMPAASGIGAAGDGAAPPEPPPQAPDAPPPERPSPYPDRGAGNAGAGVGAGVLPVAVLPWYARSAVVLPLLVLFLLIGLLIGLLLCGFRPLGWRTTAGLGLEDQRAIQSGVVDSLREERDRLKGLLSGDVCRADTAALPHGALSLPVRPSLPPSTAPSAPSTPSAASPPPATGGQETPPATPPAAATPPSAGAGNGATAAKATSLNDYLEKSTVMIVTEEGLGSGFFIGPDLIVTNRHVVELQNGRIASSLMVTSKSLGRLYPGTVQASSRDSNFGQRDYAVIRLMQAPSPAPLALPLAQSVEKRATVIAAGYPGYLVQHDPAMVRLKQGDMSAAPELVLSEGKVQVIHVPQDGVPVVVHSADISQGNSGGPLVDDCGRVVGINTFIGMDESSGRRGLFSLGSSDLIAFLQQSQIALSVDGANCAPPSR